MLLFSFALLVGSASSFRAGIAAQQQRVSRRNVFEGPPPPEEPDRSSTPPETLAAAAVGTGLAAAAGIEVLDAGVIGSSLLVGAALAWAAENEKEYGVGDVARGLGRMGWKSFKTMRSAQTKVEQTRLENDSFQTKLDAIRKGIEQDRAQMAAQSAAAEDLQEGDAKKAKEDAAADGGSS